MGGCPHARLQQYALLRAASATDALAGGAARVPMRFYATHLKYIIALIRSARTGNKLVSALVPRPPPLPERAEHPFPS